MSVYQIPIYGTVSAVVSVEADNYEEAVEKAIDNAPQTSLVGTGFDGGDDWEVAEGYYRDGEYIEPGDEADGE